MLMKCLVMIREVYLYTFSFLLEEINFSTCVVDFLVEFTITYKKHINYVNVRVCQEIIVFSN